MVPWLGLRPRRDDCYDFDSEFVYGSDCDYDYDSNSSCNSDCDYDYGYGYDCDMDHLMAIIMTETMTMITTMGMHRF